MVESWSPLSKVELEDLAGACTTRTWGDDFFFTPGDRSDALLMLKRASLRI